MKHVHLKDGTEYITLGQFLKHVGLIQTGGEAKHFLNETPVQVNDQDEARRGRKLRAGDKIVVNAQDTFYIEEL
ncbi:MAG: S4 domain-containing protein YaaA [Sporolactobacillus sp.]